MSKKCWAESLGNCSGKISREHVISECVLNEHIEGNNFSILGLPWCKDTKINIGKKNFINHSLCRFHNSKLSPFDTEAAKLFKYLKKFCKTRDVRNKIKYSKRPTVKKYKIKGELFEKWGVKTIINFIDYVGGIHIDYNRIAPYIFSTSKFIEPFGLSMPMGKEMRYYFNNNISITPLIYKEKELAGGILYYHGLIFSIHLPGYELGQGHIQIKDPNLDGTKAIWHLKEIHDMILARNKQVISQSIIFEWI